MDANVRPEETAGRLTMDMPWSWLGAGWRDMMRAPHLSIGYGALVVGGGILINWLLWRAGAVALIPVALGVFALVGPLAAVGLYEMSRRIEAGEPPALAPVKFVGPRAPLQLAYIGFFLMFAALVWVLVAMVLYAIFTAGSYVPFDRFITFAVSTSAGMTMAVIGAVAGGFIAFCIFLLTVVSVPMLMNDRTDAFSAIALGIKAFRKNPGPMLLWAWLIAVFIGAGVGTFFVGLAVAFPLLGHATWHAYRDISRLA